MIKINVGLTGATGTLGKASIPILLGVDNIALKIIIRPSKKNIRFARSLKKKYKNNITIMYGDITNKNDCSQFVHGCEYIIHAAAVIPPATDHYPTRTIKTNVDGTKNIIDAILSDFDGDNIHLIHVSSIAVYGSRNKKHPWARVGDPLIPSIYDAYSYSKILAERAVLDSNLKYYVSLRESAVLYKDMILKNMNDGLIFHTPFNGPLEWVTDYDTAILFKNIILKDASKMLVKEFWNKVYNVGSGVDGRKTGFEAINDGFMIMGRSAKDYFKPNYNITRNFHGVWFADSLVLNSYTDYLNKSYSYFWKKYTKSHWYFKVGRIIPKSWISKLVIQRLFKDPNAPRYWIDHNIEGRIDCFFGSAEKYKEIGEDWQYYKLWCEEEGYIEEKSGSNIVLTSLGFDEYKKPSEIDLNDCIKAAAFRGGKCLSTKMEKGDIYKPLRWRCFQGHEFYATPYAVLFAGHWCTECFDANSWQLDYIASHVPFYAQVWYDEHEKGEVNRIYPYKADELPEIIYENKKK
ncbi:MAG: NAD(P)-dependent oxidoreductase [Bacilli bacterium]|nr:NAD(P)-dependent oxidoreductase [Bacilli bacterium]